MNSRSKQLTILITLSLAVIFSSFVTADVEAVRVWRAPDHTRLVFDL